MPALAESEPAEMTGIFRDSPPSDLKVLVCVDDQRLIASPVRRLTDGKPTIRREQR